MASHFKVAPPSIQDWVKRGTIDKEKLPKLWAYFADVAGPTHWGLKAFPFPVHASTDTADGSPAYRTTLGGAVAQIAAGLAALPASRRKTIAQLAASQITEGTNVDEIAQIDALTPGITVAGISSWRAAAFGLAEKHPDPQERQRLTDFIRAVDRFVTAAPAPTIPATATPPSPEGSRIR